MLEAKLETASPHIKELRVLWWPVGRNVERSQRQDLMVMRSEEERGNEPQVLGLGR